MLQEHQSKMLRTVKKLHMETGASISFVRQLLRERKLTPHKINSATFVSLVEFENLASPARNSAHSRQAA
jgi:hypothetical protein